MGNSLKQSMGWMGVVGLFLVAQPGALAAKKKSPKDIGIVGPGGEIIVFYKDGSDIVIRNCGKDYAQNVKILQNKNRSDCKTVGQENRVPVEAFKRTLKSVFLITDADKVKPLTSDEVRAYRGAHIGQVESLKSRKKELHQKLAEIRAFIEAAESDDPKVLRDFKETDELLKAVQNELNGAKAGSAAVKKINGLIDDLVDKQIASSQLKLVFSPEAKKNESDQYIYTVLKQYDAGRPECGTGEALEPGESSPEDSKGSIKGAWLSAWISEARAQNTASTEERIKDCARILGSKASITPKSSGVKWDLVSRKRDRSSGKFYEVWRDSKSGLLWGDKLDSNYSHHNAVALRSTSPSCKVDDKSPNWSKNCPVTQEKACDSDEGNRAAAGITDKAFGLPTIQEFIEAEANGVRDVLPNMAGNWFWSSSLDSSWRGVRARL